MKERISGFIQVRFHVHSGQMSGYETSLLKGKKIMKSTMSDIAHAHIVNNSDFSEQKLIFYTVALFT